MSLFALIDADAEGLARMERDFVARGDTVLACRDVGEALRRVAAPSACACIVVVVRDDGTDLATLRALLGLYRHLRAIPLVVVGAAPGAAAAISVSAGASAEVIVAAVLRADPEALGAAAVEESVDCSAPVGMFRLSRRGEVMTGSDAADPLLESLHDARDLVRTRWETRVRQELRTEGPLALAPALADVLDVLVDGRARDEAGAIAGRGTFTIDRLAAERRILGEVVLELLEEEEPLDEQRRALVLDLVDEAVREVGPSPRPAREARKADAGEAPPPEDLARGQFRFLVDAVEDIAIFTLDPQGVITSWNPGAQRIKGYAEQEVLGRHFSLLYPPEGRLRDEPMDHLRVARDNGRFRGEGLRMRKDGELYLADVLITPICVDGVLRGFAKFVQDLTERNALVQERDLSRARASELQAEAAYRERFVATLAHDLRSSLTSAAMNAERIERVVGDPEKVRALVARVLGAVDRTDRMIGDLLDAARLDAGERIALRFERCDLAALVEQVVEEQAAEHGDRFVVRTEGATIGTWNRDALRRVLENLLSNALKYGDARAPITIGVRRVDGHVLWTVHNKGSPIGAEDLARLFQPFRRTREAERSGKQGWGLGLTVIRGLVEAHGGVVKVRSLPEAGTTFTIDLPVDASARP